MKIIGSITGYDLPTSWQQIAQAAALADVLELRLDYWQTLDITAVAQLLEKISVPVILTLRKKSQGGLCELPETQRLALIEQLAELSPDYIDLEYDVPKKWLSQFRRNFPQIQLIGSYHDFNETPADLMALARPLIEVNFDITKIATFAQNINDTLRMLIFVQTISEQHPIIGLAMGEYGQISRILAPVIGSLFTYGCTDTDSASAPGQLSLSELRDIYRVHLLNRDTAIYALLGDPVSQSPGHLKHNRAFAALNKNAVYVKCRVNAENLGATMMLLRQLPFHGFSVTIPHKETIVPYVDEPIGEAATTHIVNTIKRDHDHYQGFNTDGPGAAAALEEITSLPHQRVLILGAGGSAKAIAYSLLIRKAKITLCNRTLSRAQAFTEKFGGNSIDFHELFSTTEFPYDIVINTLPEGGQVLNCERTVHNSRLDPFPRIAMDIVLKPLATPFIQSAQAAGWRCLTGDALFVAQGLRQLKIWFNLPDLPEVSVFFEE